ncbi:DUF3054 domain-containing protein [Gordonia hydrophobica]|uniref:DUF3054 domain-containing protein n=1 Tax=Gordonia hydrophobica TaxID=40516 RepID=A0ABZ2U704_9ACTN|nr:DUF3054 domain-containing protein [Gordonia hydrophobica]MBM7365614.1 hypothetical protein [Gordonia hydrophobica]
MTAPSPARRFAVPAVLDVVAVVVFIAIGRRSHDESGSVTGFLTSLWPFLVGLAAGWAIAAAVTRGRSFAPSALVPSGVVVWISTVVIGMLLRVASAQGTALAFCIVASIATAVLLLGWRAVALVIAKRAAPGHAAT